MFYFWNPPIIDNDKQESSHISPDDFIFFFFAAHLNRTVEGGQYSFLLIFIISKIMQKKWKPISIEYKIDTSI